MNLIYAPGDHMRTQLTTQKRHSSNSMSTGTRAGPRERMRRRFGSTASLKKGDDAGGEGDRDAALVKRVMETSGGDNEALARKIHERYDRCAPVSTCPARLRRRAPVSSARSICGVGVSSAACVQGQREAAMRGVAL